MKPEIKNLQETKLVGMRIKMSFSNNKTFELWHKFSPRLSEISERANDNLFSVEIYPDVTFFREFDPFKEFEKWAAVDVKKFETIPENMDRLIIPEGLYAVFHYVGKPSEAMATYQYIFGSWLPGSEYALDNRPHFAVMGEKYKGESSDSEEDFWIPIKNK